MARAMPERLVRSSLARNNLMITCLHSRKLVLSDITFPEFISLSLVLNMAKKAAKAAAAAPKKAMKAMKAKKA